MAEYAHTPVSLMTRLTERDLAIVCDVHEHQTLTTPQITRVHFPQTGDRRARRRLLALYRYGVLDRFRRYTSAGKLPDHWILGRNGAQLLAYHRQVQVSDLDFRSDQAQRLGYSVQLRHVLGLAESFVLFVEAGRGPGELVRWYGERECARRWGVYIRPDGYLCWNQEGSDLRAFFEYDTGTESLEKVRRKMAGYANLARYREVTSVVLFAVHSDKREEHLAARLRSDVPGRVGVYITTHARLAGPGPARAVWRAADASDRFTLVDIARRHPLPEHEPEE